MRFLTLFASLALAVLAGHSANAATIFLDDFSTNTASNYLKTGNPSGNFSVTGGEFVLNHVNISGQSGLGAFYNTPILGVGQFVAVDVLGGPVDVRLTVSTSASAPTNTNGSISGIRLWRNVNVVQSGVSNAQFAAQLRNGTTALNSTTKIISPSPSSQTPITFYVFRDTATQFRAGIDVGDGNGIQFISQSVSNTLISGEIITIANAASVTNMYIGVEAGSGTGRRFDNLRVETIPVPEPASAAFLGGGCLAALAAFRRRRAT